MNISSLDQSTIELIISEYKKNSLDWTIGYSGGKDSTALLKLAYNAFSEIKNPTKFVNVVYCDTGVEIPIVKDYVAKTFKELSKESKENNILINYKIITPPIEDRFFVKVIGRGYPSPTNKFRWCTDLLRVKPIQRMLKESVKESIVLIGVRKGESIERDRIILKHYLEDVYYFKQNNFSKTKLFSPILNYSTQNVWDTILNVRKPFGINGNELESMYSFVKGDTEFVSKNKNFKEGRFGCWTCTVVRKDRAVKNLIDSGFKELKPLLEFRNWLYKVRDLESYRCRYRRNGQKNKGPFTLEARLEILEKLLGAQESSKINLIDDEEISFIYKLWNIDKNSKKYIE